MGAGPTDVGQVVRLMQEVFANLVNQAWGVCGEGGQGATGVEGRGSSLSLGASAGPLLADTVSGSISATSPP